MEPIQFPQANRVLKAPKGMANCVDLHTYRDASTITSLWKMSWRDRLRALWTGQIWLQVWTPAATHEPVSVFTENPFPKGSK